MAGLLFFICDWLYYSIFRAPRCRNQVSLRGKTVVITGANTGIGKATALDLARRGARVILACRNQARGEAAVNDIRRESGNSEVIFMSLDLASLKSVRAFAETFLRSEPRLDILINNAGVVDGKSSEDGFNMAFQVNHLGHFLLTHLLLDRLKSCAPSRVVVVSSINYLIGKIDFQNIYKPVAGSLKAFLSYSNSKLANILFTQELAKRLEGTNVTCYSLHPGQVHTDIIRSVSVLLRPLVYLISLLICQDPTSGAQTSIYCATQEGIEKLSGCYFANCQQQEIKCHACDEAVAKKLWELSERLSGLAT